MFEKLKNSSIKKRSEDLVDEIYFKLFSDDSGYYIKIVDSEDHELKNLSANNYDRTTKEIIKAIENIKESSFFTISWYDSADNIYLNEHPFLLELLKKTKFFINENGQSIKTMPRTRNLKVLIESTNNEEILESKLVLDYDINDFDLLTEDTAICENRLYSIKSVGENYLNIQELNSTFNIKELEKFLTIMYSYFDEIEVDYKDCEIHIGGRVEAKPLLIIEKIDRDRSLYLKVGTYISNLDHDFLSEYDIKNVVTVNDMENKIQISDIQMDDLKVSIGEILKIIVKYQRALKIRDGYYLDGNLIIMQETLAKEFITKELSNLLATYKIIGTDKFRKYNIKTTKPKLITNFAHSINFLEGDVHLEVEGEQFSIFDIISMYKENSYITLSDGSSALINKKYIDKLERLFKKNKEKKKVKMSIFDLPLLEELIEEKTINSEFNKSKEIFLGFNKLKDNKVEAPSIKATLREYQEYGYKWLTYLYSNNLGGCLADDMGLGKTIQTISLLSFVYPKAEYPSLIVMPKSLIYNWDSEIRKFNPNLKVGIYYGTNRDLDDALRHQLILTTYGTVRNDVEKLSKLKFEMVVLDESQNIKNINSQSTKAVMLLNSDHRLALSGTPVENNLGELYSLFRFLNPQMFGSAEEFNSFYVNPIQKENDREVIAELRKKIYPFILRRTKKQVLKELPEKVEQTLYIDMNPKQKKLYEERRNFYYNLVNSQVQEHGIAKSQFFILQALNELRQIASNPESKSGDVISSSKRGILMENIREAVMNNHKVLVFTNFIKTIENICSDLEDLDIKYLSMTGSTKNRQELVDKFQKDKKYKVFVMTLKTGGVGLNLTAADTIFIYDPWWNKTAEDQAVDRSHRMGQKNTVFSYKLISKGSIEEKILKLQHEKSRLFDELISDDSASLKSLTQEDIEYILGE